MTMPSEANFRELIEVLRGTSAAVVAARKDDKARLAAGLTALRAVVTYLAKSPDVLAGQLTRPLAILENVLSDAERGATGGALINIPPEDAGRPTGLSRDFVQATLAFGIEVLRQGKFCNKSAAEWIEGAAHKLGVCSENGTPILARTIIKWREEISRGAAARDACDHYEGMRKLPPYCKAFTPKGRSVAKRALCEALAMGLVKSQAALDPQTAPKLTVRSLKE
jgi:hypothetical protein